MNVNWPASNNKGDDLSNRPQQEIYTTEGVNVQAIALEDGSTYLAVDARHLHQGFGDFASVILTKEQVLLLLNFLKGLV